MLVCSILIISRLDSQDVNTLFRPPYWCTTDVHQHGVSLLGSANFCETFRRISEVWDNAQASNFGEVTYFVASYNIKIS